MQGNPSRTGQQEQQQRIDHLADQRARPAGQTGRRPAECFQQLRVGPALDAGALQPQARPFDLDLDQPIAWRFVARLERQLDRRAVRGTRLPPLGIRIRHCREQAGAGGADHHRPSHDRQLERRVRISHASNI